MKRILSLILPLGAVLALMAPLAASAQVATPTPKYKGPPPGGVKPPPATSQFVRPTVTHTPPPVVHTPPPKPIIRPTPVVVHNQATPPPKTNTTPLYRKPVTNPNVATGQPTPNKTITKGPGYHKPPPAGPGGAPMVNNKVFVKNTPAIVHNTSWAGPKAGGGGGGGGQVFNRSNNYGGNWVAASAVPSGWNRTQVNFYNGHHYRWFNGGWLIVDNGFWPAGYYQIQPGGAKMWNAQAELANMGYYNGTVDGVPGPETRQAIADYQADNGLPIDGHLNPPTQVSLGLEPPDYAAGYNQ